MQSDFLKSLSSIVFPIVSLAHGNIRSDSSFCQVNGFFLAVSISSADIAVLLIALHSVMYIFRPRSGLYPYRQIAYFFFYLYPITAASLAFIGGNGYENVGHYCYLRSDTGWSRLALSWIPRYIICSSLVIIYVFIYLYVWRRIGDYGRRHSEVWQQSRWRADSGTVLTTHCLSSHGLIPSISSSRRTSATDTIASAKARHKSTFTAAFRLGNYRGGGKAPQSAGSVQWNWRGFGQTHPEGSRPPLEDDAADPIDPAGIPVSPPAAAHVHGSHQPLPLNSPSDEAQNKPCKASFMQARHHLQRILRVLPPDTPSTSIDLDLNPLPSPATPCIIATQRDRIRRQLRSLFVYPLAYIIVWVFPFVSHLLHTDNPIQGNEPAWLLAISIISLCSQGAVDCGLFLGRERPWRYASDQDKGIDWWSCLGWGGRGGWERRGERWGDGGEGVGRSREEALVDGRLARERREGEIVSEVERAAARGKGRELERPREWWEVWEGVGNGYSDGDGLGDDRRLAGAGQGVG